MSLFSLFAFCQSYSKLWKQVEKYIQDHYDQEYLKRVYICSDGGGWIKTAVNHIFYSWVFGFGGKVKILEPQEVVDGYTDMVLCAANALVKEM